MNVQDVIEKALAGNDGIPVTPVEHSSCEDMQVEKLASALNFIGANLESSVADLEKTALDYKAEDLLDRGPVGGGVGVAYNVGSTLGLAGGGIGKAKARKKMEAAGFSDAEINEALAGSTRRGAAKSLVGGVLGAGAGLALGRTRLAKNLDHVNHLMSAGNALGSLAGGYSGYRGAMNRAEEAIAARNQKKTASVDDALYHAAQVGKQALLEKVAEDRINPAQISAGPAAPYSGEIMPRGESVFGGQTMPAQLVAMKAQKVRARINSDMKKFVNNVGSGYNLEGHLNKMNK